MHHLVNAMLSNTKVCILGHKVKSNFLVWYGINNRMDQVHNQSFCFNQQHLMPFLSYNKSSLLDFHQSKKDLIPTQYSMLFLLCEARWRKGILKCQQLMYLLFLLAVQSAYLQKSYFKPCFGSNLLSSIPFGHQFCYLSAG